MNVLPKQTSSIGYFLVIKFHLYLFVEINLAEHALDR